MADFDAQIQESQKQVAEAQAKISAVTAQIETARTKLDQGLSIDVENATLDDVNKHTEVMNANIAELIMGLDDVTAGFSKDFDEMRSKTGMESFVGIFSTAKSESMRQERLRTASIDDKLQDLIAKSDVIVRLLQGQLDLLNTQKSRVEVNLGDTLSQREGVVTALEATRAEITAMDPKIIELENKISVEQDAAARTKLETDLAELNARPMRRIGRSRHDLFAEIERPALQALPPEPFEYAEWKQAKVHPDYHIDVLHSFYSVPHRLIGKKVDVRLTHRMVEIFHNHDRVAVHTRRGTRGGHSTTREHMPKAHQRHAGMTPEYLITRAGRVGYHIAVLVERLMRDRPHPEQGYRSALGVLSLERRFGRDRLEAACDRALIHNTVSYASVQSILVTGLDKAATEPDPILPTPRHDNIRGPAYYQ